MVQMLIEMPEEARWRRKDPESFAKEMASLAAAIKWYELGILL